MAQSVHAAGVRSLHLCCNVCCNADAIRSCGRCCCGAPPLPSCNPRAALPRAPALQDYANLLLSTFVVIALIIVTVAATPRQRTYFITDPTISYVAQASAAVAALPLPLSYIHA